MSASPARTWPPHVKSYWYRTNSKNRALKLEGLGYWSDAPVQEDSSPPNLFLGWRMNVKIPAQSLRKVAECLDGEQMASLIDHVGEKKILRRRLGNHSVVSVR